MDGRAPGEPQLTLDLGFWRKLQTKSAEPQMETDAEALYQALMRTAPSSYDTGIFHGDYHVGNVMFRPDASVSGVVDWEISGLGAQLLDLAWLSMFLDKSCWAADQQAVMKYTIDPGLLRDEYAAASGRDLSQFDWFQAYGAYRFGVISAFNIRLHRTGKRPDAHWETRVDSVATLFARGQELLAH